MTVLLVTVPTEFQMKSAGPVILTVASYGIRLPRKLSVWPAKKSSGYSFDSYLLSSSIPICSENPRTGAKAGPKLVRTTPEGRMNSLLPPPRFEMPAGIAPAKMKPSRAFAPVASGAGGVNTYSPARLSGLTASPSQVQRGFSQCKPPVSTTCRSAWGW